MKQTSFRCMKASRCWNDEARGGSIRMHETKAAAGDQLQPTE